MNSTNSAPLREKNRITAAVIVLTAALFLASCQEPSPLYGTWADNRGNTFSFFADGNFSARVARTGFQAQNYNGSYSLLMNVITLTSIEPELRIVTEWDIRGNILYLDWTSAEGDAMSLTLFKISN